MDVQSELGVFYWMRLGAGCVVAVGALLFIYAVFMPRRQEVITSTLRTPQAAE
jgi:nitric oxide reductase subunit B